MGLKGPILILFSLFSAVFGHFRDIFAKLPCTVSEIKGAFVLIQNLHKPVAIQHSLNHERWWFGTVANGESNDLYKTCVEDPVTAFVQFSTRMENLCDVTCIICKEYMAHRKMKFEDCTFGNGLASGTTNSNGKKTRRQIVDENKRKKKNLMRRTKDELLAAARGQTITEVKPFKKK